MDYHLDSRIKEEATLLLDLWRELPSNPQPQRKGGVLYVAAKDFLITNETIIGEVSDPTKLSKYRILAREKAHRLYAHSLREPDIAVSSWQTRDLSKGAYGGAVKFNDIFFKVHMRSIFSFSGLTEEGDEALSLMMALGFRGERNDGLQERVIEISKNTAFYDLQKARNSRAA